MILVKCRRKGGDLLAFGPDSRMLAARSESGLQVWMDFSDKPRVFREVRSTASIQFTPDGRTLVFDGAVAGTIDLNTNEVRFFPEPGGYRYLCLVRGGTGLLEIDLPSGRKRNSIACRPLSDAHDRKKPHWKIPLKRHFAGRPIEVAGDRFIVEEGQGVHDGGRRYCCTVRDEATGTKLAETPLIAWFSERDAASPDGKWVARQHTNAIRILNLDRPADPPVERTTGSRKIFTDVAFHPSGRWLAAASTDGTVKFFESGSWPVARTYSWNIGKMVGVAFSPDGLLAAAGSDQGRIAVWDVDED